MLKKLENREIIYIILTTLSIGVATLAILWSIAMTVMATDLRDQVIDYKNKVCLEMKNK